MRSKMLLAALFAALYAAPVSGQDPLQAAQAELDAGRAAAALEQVQGLLATEPDNVAARLLEAAAHEALGDRDAAIAAYQRALATDPESGATYLQLGWLYLRGENWAAAVSPLERARELLPDQPLPRALLAVAYRETARPADAVTVLDEALALDADDGNLWLDAAVARDAAGDAGRALEAAEAAARLLPDSAEAQLLRAGLLLRAGNPDSLVLAPAAFRRAIALQPESETAWRGLAEAYVELSMWEEGETAQRQVLALGEPTARDWMNLAFSQARQGEYEDAVTGYTRAISLQPVAGWAWFYRGEALVNLDRQDEGMVDLRRSADLLPAEVIPLLVLARTLTERGNGSAADAYLLRAAQMQPRNPEVGLEQGRSWLQQERYPEAIALLRGVLAAVPELNEARYLLGQALMRSGDAVAGRAMLQEYESLGGEQQQARRESVADRDRVLLIRGRVLIAEGRWQDALAPLRAAADLAPDRREVWELLVQCHEALGDQAAADAARAKLAGIG